MNLLLKTIRVTGMLLLCAFSFSSVRAQTLSSTERSMVSQGMVNIHKYDSTIQVRLMYAKPDNFTKRILYTDIRHAFLHPKAAKALAKAQTYLKQEHPNWSLVVFDACRPMSVQQAMWNTVKGSPCEIYVSNPARGGGLHNYGMAVDISICDAAGDTLDMGTLVDHMGYRAHIDKESTLVAQHKISSAAYKNRLLLRRVMQKAGFHALRTEWWHFNLIYRAEARRNYPYVK